MSIVLSDADGTLFPATLGSNAHYTDEMQKNLHKIYHELTPLPWTVQHSYLFKARVFILHTGREERFNLITRESIARHFGVVHFRIQNVAFAGSHANYVNNKIDVLIKLIEYWKVRKEKRETIKVIDDDQDVIRPIHAIYYFDNDVECYTVTQEGLINL